MPVFPPVPSSFTTTVVPIVRPERAAAVALTYPGLWTNGYGAWVQLAAANDLASHALAYLDLVATDIAAGDVGLLVEWQLQIGTGAAGSEVVRATFHGMLYGTDGTTGNVLAESFPLLTIPANARVAARMAGNIAANRISLTVRAEFYPTPL